MSFLARVFGASGGECSLFGSRSVAAHLARGVVAATAASWALPNLSAHPILAIGGVAVAIIAMRGCPMCWTVGLFETILRRR